MPEIATLVPDAPELESRPEFRDVIVCVDSLGSLGRSFWKTPGAALAEELQDVFAIQYLFETMRSESWGIVVVLSDDRDDVLDRVFDAERKLYSEFSGTRLDVRVTKMTEDLDPQELRRASTYCHLNRA